MRPAAPGPLVPSAFGWAFRHSRPQGPSHRHLHVLVHVGTRFSTLCPSPPRSARCASPTLLDKRWTGLYHSNGRSLMCCQELGRDSSVAVGIDGATVNTSIGSRFPFFATLRFRLLVLVLLIIVPLLGLTLVTNVALRRGSAVDAQREALRIARIAAADQEDTIRDARQLLFALSQLPEVHSGDPGTCSEFFTKLLNQYPQYAALGAVAPDGKLVCSSPPASAPTDVNRYSYFRRAVQDGRFAVGDYESDALTDKATLDVGYPVLGETGQVEAVVFASLDLSWLNQLAAEALLPAGSTLTVVDANGTILVRHPDPQNWVGLSVLEAPIVEFIMARQGEGTTDAYGIDGIRRLFAVTPLSSVSEAEDAYVSVGIPTAVAFAEANRMLVRSLTSLGGLTILVLAAAWLGSDVFILRQVSAMVSAAERLGTGDLSARTGLSREGELGRLALTFDKMADSLQRGVDERDRAEGALRESERVLSTLLSNLPGMAYRRRNDRGWRMEFVSEGSFELTGYRPSELIGNRKVAYGQLIHRKDREFVWNEVQVALQENRPFQITYRVITAAGEEKWAWEHGCGVSSPEGDALALEGYVLDATEQVLAQERLEHRLADRTRELSALYEVAAVSSGALDLETILVNSLDRVLAVIGSRVGAVHLYDEASGVLRLAAQCGVPSDLVSQVESVSASIGLAGQVVKGGQPLVVPDIANGLRPLLAIPVSRPQAYVGVPLRAKGQVLGVLSVVGEVERQFDEAEVSVLSSIGDQIGLAVENARLRQQSEHLAVVRERERLARDLHDSVTQSLFSVTLLAEAGRQLAGAGDLERVERCLERLGQISQQALKEMRLLVYELRPSVLEREGLAGALQRRLDAVEKRAGIDARLLVEGEIDLPAAVEAELYHVAQEALNNALKHAGASSVTVNICGRGNCVEFEVIDTGAGFNPDAVADHGGIGLSNMRERAEKLGGSLTVLSEPAQGTRVRIKVEVSRD